jgi:type I restriction enzyme S subunit
MTFETELLGEHISLIKGLSYKGEYLAEESSLGLLGLDAFVTGGGYKAGAEKPYTGPFKPEHLAVYGDVLLAMTEQQDGLLASPLLVPEELGGYEELVLSHHVAKVVVKSERLTPEFIYNFFRVPINRIRAAYGNSGTTVQDLPYEVVYEQKIPLPSIEEQERINEFIGNIDRQLMLKQQISQQLVRIVTTIFRQWFVEPCLKLNEGNSLDAPDEWSLPHGWTMEHLGEHLTCLETGKRPVGGVKGITSGIPSIGAESINGIGVFDFLKTKYVPEDFVSKMKRGIPEDFDVLLYKDGGRPGEFQPRIGMFGAGFPFEKFVLNEHVFMLRSGDLGQPYLYMWIAQQGMMNRLAEMGAKAAVPGINQEHVKSLKIAVPPESQLARFNEIASDFILASLKQMKDTIVLSQVRDAILPQLVDGRIRLQKAWV